jgi:hypothetical protein
MDSLVTPRRLYELALELERELHDAGQHEAAAHVSRARCVLAVEVTRAQIHNQEDPR